MASTTDGIHTWIELADPAGGAALRLCAPVDPPDRLADEIARHAWSPPAPLRLVLDLLGPGRTLLDLGAHLGTVALTAARSGAHVVAVEASPRNARCLAESITVNELDVTLLPVAVASQRGSVHFREDGPFGQVSQDATGVEVDALPVPDILERAGIARADVVKIDVEGQELAVLDGMASLLASPDSPTIIIEGNGFTLAGSGLTPSNLIARLAAHGLAVWRVGDGELTPVRAGELQPETVADYLAMPPAASPPWPVTPPLSDDQIASMIATEARHHVWSHRSYVAGVLESADPSFVDRPEVRAALECLVLDRELRVRANTRWWLARPESRSAAGLAASWRAFGDALSARVAASSTV
jgi:FkbM family methyltransferase